MSDLDDVLRRYIQEEIRRAVRPEALVDAVEIADGDDDQELRQLARAAAVRLRRARDGQ